MRLIGVDVGGTFTDAVSFDTGTGVLLLGQGLVDT